MTVPLFITVPLFMTVPLSEHGSDLLVFAPIITLIISLIVSAMLLSVTAVQVSFVEMLLMTVPAFANVAPNVRTNAKPVVGIQPFNVFLFILFLLLQFFARGLCSALVITITVPRTMG
jgi:hypothetical protein